MCNIMYPNCVHPNHGGCRNSHSERRRGLEATAELKTLQGDHGTTGTAGIEGAAGRPWDYRTTRNRGDHKN